MTDQLDNGQREQAARWYGAQRGPEDECLADDLIAAWRRQADDLAFRATLNPYPGTVILAILWGEVIPAGWTPA